MRCDKCRYWATAMAKDGHMMPGTLMYAIIVRSTAISILPTEPVVTPPLWSCQGKALKPSQHDGILGVFCSKKSIDIYALSMYNSDIKL